jgi:hypothetical protein
MVKCQLCGSSKDFTLNGLSGHIQYKHKTVKWFNYKRKYINTDGYTSKAKEQQNNRDEYNKDGLPWDFKLAHNLFKTLNRNMRMQGEDVNLWTSDIFDFLRLCIESTFTLYGWDYNAILARAMEMRDQEQQRIVIDPWLYRLEIEKEF